MHATWSCLLACGGRERWHSEIITGEVRWLPLVRRAADSRNCSHVGALRPEMRTLALEMLTSALGCRDGCRDAAVLPAALSPLEQVTATASDVPLHSYDSLFI